MSAIACISDGEVLTRGLILTDNRQIEGLFGGIERLGLVSEASTNYGYYYDLLEGLGHRVVVAPPLKTRMRRAIQGQSQP